MTELPYNDYPVTMNYQLSCHDETAINRYRLHANSFVTR